MNTVQFPFTLRRLVASNSGRYRDLRLEGLRLYPEAFGASWEDEVVQPLAWFTDRLARGSIFGGFDGAGTLLGVVGLRIPEAAKLKHKGFLWGMVVRPEAHGTGLSDALVVRLIEHATGLVEEVQLMVVATNAVAVRLYTRMGFIQYALEPRSLKIGDTYYDELLMTRRLP